MWVIISNIGSVITILGVGIFSAFSDATKAWISVGIFACLAIFGGIQIYRVSYAVLNRRYPKGYLPISSSARYTTSDGLKATYEVVRHIQVKKPVMTSFEHKFFWSGSKSPRIESDIQTCGDVREIADDRRKFVRLKFPQARIYNDVEIIHIKMALDDSDKAASPYLSLQVEEPIRLVNFRVELLHRVAPHHLGQLATISQTPIENLEHAVKQEIATVAFDGVTRSFAYQVVNPEPGYIYTLEWQRDPPPPAQQQKRGKRKAPPPATEHAAATQAPQNAAEVPAQPAVDGAGR
ncbi:hypothetical protein [Paraburkholderia acidipaludis]|uniref:hypothetical protein n=1 Tax=Paraburkholderia acidipaludis TaxID=660537 RepID=UPI0012EC171A|nr:hypothetical protein [Paraburkholderia acidipaludis]